MAETDRVLLQPHRGFRSKARKGGGGTFYFQVPAKSYLDRTVINYSALAEEPLF